MRRNPTAALRVVPERWHVADNRVGRQSDSVTGTDVDDTAQLGERPAAPRALRCRRCSHSLATILIVDVLVRSLVEGIFTRNAADWPYNPAVTRIAGIITSRFLEVLAVLIALAHPLPPDPLRLLRRPRSSSPRPHVAAGRLCGSGRRPGARGLIAYVPGLVPGDRLLYPGPWPIAPRALPHRRRPPSSRKSRFAVSSCRASSAWPGAARAAEPSRIVISGLLFASLHLLAPFQLTWAWWIVVTMAGLGFGWAFYAAGRNLWLTIGLHLGFDLGLFLLLGLPGETHGWIISPALGSVPSLSQVGGYIIAHRNLLTLLTLLLLLNRRQKRGVREHESRSACE